mgnify:FL=1
MKKSNITDEEILLELCSEYNLPMYKMKAICHYPFKYALEVMRRMNDDTILLPSFGKFYMNRKRHLAGKITNKDLREYMEIYKKDIIDKKDAKKDKRNSSRVL